MAGAYDVVVSESIMAEYNEVLRRERFGFDEEDIDFLIDWLYSNALMVEVNETFARPREILIRALLCGAVSIIMLHNHPSMDTPYPSKQDIVMTTNLVKACNMIGIVCLDHIIISGNDYCSLKKLDKSLFEVKNKHL